MDGATSAHYGQSTRIDSLRFGSCCALRNAARSLRRRCCLRPAGGAATTAMRQEGPAARGRCLHPIDERGREGERRAEARETKRQEGDGVGGRRGWTARLAATSVADRDGCRLGVGERRLQPSRAMRCRLGVGRSRYHERLEGRAG